LTTINCLVDIEKLYYIHINFYVFIFTILYQSNNPPISTSSSGSSTFAGACTAAFGSSFAATGAVAATGALLDYLI